MWRGFTLGVCAVLMLLSGVSSAASLSDFLAGMYSESSTGKSLPYRLFVPDGYDPAKEYPLVLYLHGSGDKGTDNEQQVTGNCINNLLAHLKMPQYSAFLLAPQAPVETGWVSVTAEPRPALRMSLDLIGQLGEQYNIDSNRLYITGLSLGGGGTWDAISRNPEMFAAAVPICGWGDTSKAPLLVDQPIWAFHNIGDPTVYLSEEQAMIDAVRAAGGDPLFTKYPVSGHDAWTEAYGTDALYDWMFSQSRQAAPAVPEASTVALLASGAPGLLLLARRRRQRHGVAGA